ncbi:MAG: TetR family transcriptional regulator [Proteobacteria bacterium]|nr:TetR family transcriptional regulator [Pseudomonadota bacterium]MBU1688242.1 TetR family transcriptional regulator [Pseudomonadota bacterium]
MATKTTENTPLSPEKAIRIQDKHRKIILAAIKVFARKGFFSARISDIAQEAEVADGTIYLYFNNKYDILISIFEEEIGKIIVDIKERINQEEDPKRMLRLFAANHMRLVKERKDLSEVLQMELRQSNKFMREYRNTRFIEYVDIISRIIHKGQELNVFRKDVLPGVAKRAFFGALDETARLWILSPTNQYTIEEAANQISSIFLSGIEQAN